MVTSGDVERVYGFIWEYLLEHEVLAKPQHVAHGLNMSYNAVMDCVNLLRKSGRLRPASMYPAAYDEYWRKHIRAENLGEVQIAPLPKTKYKIYRNHASKKPAS